MPLSRFQPVSPVLARCRWLVSALRTTGGGRAPSRARIDARHSLAGPEGHWLWPRPTKGPVYKPCQEETGLSNSPAQCSRRLALEGVSTRNGGTVSVFVGFVGAGTPVWRAARRCTPRVRRHGGKPAQSNPASLAEHGLQVSREIWALYTRAPLGLGPS